MTDTTIGNPNATSATVEIQSWAPRLKALGISPPDFAARVPVPYRTLQNYLSGKSEPLASTYTLIVEKLQELESAAVSENV